jgi:hypothetical protein
MTIEEMRSLLRGLLEMRYRGVTQATVDGRQVQYASGPDLAAAISDLEGRIASEEGRGRSVFYVTSRKGL